MSTLTERVVALETALAAQIEANTALAQRLNEAHARIDNAAWKREKVMSTLTERVVALETAPAAQIEANTALAQRLNEAHARIDDAARLFAGIRRTLTPKREPGSYIPPAEFDRAVADLRHESGDKRARFPLAAIRERAQALRTLDLRDEAA